MSVCMPEPGLKRHEPLAGCRHRDERRRLVIEALGPGTMLQVILASSHEPGTERLMAVASLAGLVVRVSGSGQAWMAGPSPLPAEAVGTIAAALGVGATVIDQSHGRVRIMFEGAGARRVLSTGTALDLSDRAFPVGASADTVFGAIAVTLTRIADFGYELAVGRSFAESLWHEIAAREAT
jgi:sarcosine oxidase subunit gamma